MCQIQTRTQNSMLRTFICSPTSTLHFLVGSRDPRPRRWPALNRGVRPEGVMQQRSGGHVGFASGSGSGWFAPGHLLSLGPSQCLCSWPGQRGQQGFLGTMIIWLLSSLIHRLGLGRCRGPIGAQRGTGGRVVWASPTDER